VDRSVARGARLLPLALLLMVGCTNSSSHAAGIARTVTLGIGQNVFVASPLRLSHPPIASATASKTIDSAMTADQWPDGRRVQFGFASVTTESTSLGHLVNRPAWVAVYSVPGTDIAPGTGTQTQLAPCALRSANPRVEIAVIVDAQSGEAGIWNQVPCR
jgi:hypothetical protein